MSTNDHDPMGSAQQFLTDLSSSEIYREIFPGSAVVLGGSYSTGRADTYSDVDLFLFVDDERFPEAQQRAIARGLARTGGDWSARRVTSCEIFVKVRSYEELCEELDGDLAVAYRIYSRAQIWADPSGKFSAAMAKYAERFASEVPALVRQTSLALRRCIKFGRDSHLRGNAVAFDLLRHDYLTALLQMFFLLEGEPFPYSKWLHPVAMDETEAGRAIGDLVESISGTGDRAEHLKAMRSAYLYIKSEAARRNLDDPGMISPEVDGTTRFFEEEILSEIAKL
ncbi:putative nucleotidyltransferase [Kitasatospora sp. MAA4]|uniref:nucleotidyltransferase domain-containing protein n=1 Tax=Kitasatospora sp. MAA4 TaxID=3035093 RepID=UPI0024752B85|nr:nucleotidyltransferase domain-containing protein [Kitasatospora sp. MAA4]MDH6134161.1 putative nucleotidyltransferase [Kitasatospora sp. MAA4]